MKVKILFLLTISTLTGFSQAYDTLPNLPDHYGKRMEAFRKEKVSQGRVMFLGNSITEGGDWKMLLKDTSVVNRGISGDVTYGILYRIDEITRYKPAKIFLLIGTNDISKDIPDDKILENIYRIARKIKDTSPKTTVYVQSILPTNKNVKGFPVRYDKNDHVTTINGQLQKYADRLNYTFVDLYSKFTDSEQRLDAKYTFDGLHLNASGYLKWVEILKSFKYL